MSDADRCENCGEWMPRCTCPVTARVARAPILETRCTLCGETIDVREAHPIGPCVELARRRAVERAETPP